MTKSERNRLYYERHKERIKAGRKEERARKKAVQHNVQSLKFEEAEKNSDCSDSNAEQKIQFSERHAELSVQTSELAEHSVEEILVKIVDLNQRLKEKLKAEKVDDLILFAEALMYPDTDDAEQAELLEDIRWTVDRYQAEHLKVKTERQPLQHFGSEQKVVAQQEEKKISEQKEQIRPPAGPDKSEVAKPSKTSLVANWFASNRATLVLYTLVACFTGFLIKEQIEFYQLKQYDFLTAICYASLLDVALVGLGFLASWLPKRGLADWNWLVIPMLLVCIAALGSITFVHVGKRSQAVEGLSTEQVELKSLLTKRVGELEARSKLDLAAISDMPDSYVTARKEAQERYDSGVGKELKEARLKLESFLTQNAGKSAVSQVEQWSMIGFRWLAILLNVLFAGLAGALTRRKN